MSTEMRILTVRQPWAWAIIHGGKDVENRVRNIAGDYRGTVAIHAGLSKPEKDNMASHAHREAFGTEAAKPLLFGAIIGVVDLTEAHFGQSEVCPKPLGMHEDGQMDWAYCSPWAEPGVWHLELKNPRPLHKPLPFTGALGLRRLDTTTIDLIQKELT